MLCGVVEVLVVGFVEGVGGSCREVCVIAEVPLGCERLHLCNVLNVFESGSTNGEQGTRETSEGCVCTQQQGSQHCLRNRH